MPSDPLTKAPERTERVRVAETEGHEGRGYVTFVDHDWGGWSRAEVYGSTQEESRSRALRFAAGFNLLEALDRIGNVEAALATAISTCSEEGMEDEAEILRSVSSILATMDRRRVEQLYTYLGRWLARL